MSSRTNAPKTPKNKVAEKSNAEIQVVKLKPPAPEKDFPNKSPEVNFTDK
jgi:hypothetical protein